MAITPLYGSHITFVGEGPRSLEPHAQRIIFGPFGLTPRTPNHHRYILQTKVFNACCIAWCLSDRTTISSKKVPKHFFLRSTGVYIIGLSELYYKGRCI